MTDIISKKKKRGVQGQGLVLLLFNFLSRSTAVVYRGESARKRHTKDLSKKVNVKENKENVSWCVILRNVWRVTLQI